MANHDLKVPDGLSVSTLASCKGSTRHETTPFYFQGLSLSSLSLSSGERARDGGLPMFDPHDLIGDMRRLSTGVTSVNLDIGTRNSTNYSMKGKGVGDLWGMKRLGRRAREFVLVVAVVHTKGIAVSHHKQQTPSSPS